MVILYDLEPPESVHGMHSGNEAPELFSLRLGHSSGALPRTWKYGVEQAVSSLTEGFTGRAAERDSLNQWATTGTSLFTDQREKLLFKQRSLVHRPAR